jgi:hypothetical protein
MPIDFPDTPTNGQTHTVGTKSWTYNATDNVWYANADSSAVTLTGIQTLTNKTLTLPVIPNALFGYTTTETAAGTTTLSNTSNYFQFFTGTTTQTVTLPVASTMTLGQGFEIHNNSTGAVTVNSSGSNLVVIVNAGQSVRITNILTSGTTAASWDADVTGSSTSTGTGNLVFSNSPVLITPNIGTPSFATLTNATGLPVTGITASTSAALGVGTIELGHATDTTLARGAAGRLTVEGANVVTASSTDTLTNKTLTSPVINTSITTGSASIDLFTTTATTVNLANAATTFNIAGAGTTINIANTATAAQTFNLGGASTGASTYNFGTGATAAATTKTLNLGTGGAASSTTDINIGSSNGGTTTISSPNVTVSGNLTVSGTTTTINTATLNIADNLVTLNSDFTSGTPTENAGIEVLRGSSSTVSVRWNESTDKWEFTNDGTNYTELGGGGGGGVGDPLISAMLYR